MLKKMKKNEFHIFRTDVLFYASDIFCNFKWVSGTSWIIHTNNDSEMKSEWNSILKFETVPKKNKFWIIVISVISASVPNQQI